MARKRILSILTSCDFEGVWQQCSRLSADLPPDLFDTRIALLSGTGSDIKLWARTGLPVYTVGSGRTVEPVSLWPLVRLIHKHQPDLVHCWDSTTNVYGTLAARIAGVRTIFCSVWQPTAPTAAWKEWVQRLLKNRITKMIVPNPILCETDLALMQLADGVVEIIPPGIARYAAPPADRNRLTAKLGIPEKSHLIATCDSLESAAPIREMIWATELLKVAGHNVRVFICGKGHKRRAIERFRNQVRLEEEIYFLEDHQLIAELMGHLDVYWQFGGPRGKSVIPSIEAMRRAIPVIADKSVIHQELLKHERTGIVVPCGDPASLASWTQQLLEHPDQCRNIGVAGRDSIENRFEQEATTAAVTQLYLRSLGISYPVQIPQP